MKDSAELYGKVKKEKAELLGKIEQLRVLGQPSAEAARKGISLNELVRELLQANTEDDGEYQASAERQIKRMKERIQLGTKGKIAWKRDQLHQR